MNLPVLPSTPLRQQIRWLWACWVCSWLLFPAGAGTAVTRDTDLALWLLAGGAIFGLISSGALSAVGGKERNEHPAMVFLHSFILILAGSILGSGGFLFCVLWVFDELQFVW